MNAERFRSGMQVHSVPESERAFDASGMRLPWAYEIADPDRAHGRRLPEEKGPFGRSNSRRTGSRSKTQTPSRGDRDQAENWRAIDDIFSRVKEQDVAKDNKTSPPTPKETAVAPVAQVTGTPTEVILYGFPSAFQYAAIDHYERVSQGRIFEEYDREPANAKFKMSLSLSRTRSATAMSAEALRKRNRYHGGDHWIKVTFDSADAAERACYSSPHVVNGYLVHAELYRGTAPAAGDIAIPATESALRSATASPSSKTTATVQPPSSNTLSASESSSATLPAKTNDQAGPFQARENPQSMADNPTSKSQLVPVNGGNSTAMSTSTQKPLRIRGAKRAVLLPADQALLPAPSKMQKSLSYIPLLSWFLGSGAQDGIVGSQLPRKDDGSFDWDNAALYWRVWGWVDHVLGTDFCGSKDD